MKVGEMGLVDLFRSWIGVRQATLIKAHSVLPGQSQIEQIATLDVSSANQIADTHKALSSFLDNNFDSLKASEKVWVEMWQAAPTRAIGLYGASNLCLSLGNSVWAKCFLEQCLQLEPGHVGANSRLGLLLANAQDWDAALIYLARAVDGSRANSICATNLGVALYMTGEESDAYSTLLQAYETNQNCVEVCRELFQVSLRLGKIDIAKNIVERALTQKVFVSSPGLLKEAGGALSLTGSVGDLWPRVAEAQLAVQLGQYERASNLYAAFENSHPMVSRSGRGVVCMALGRFRKAHDLFSEAMKLSTTPPAQLFVNRAKAAEALARHQEAMEDLNQALILQPDLHSARLERGVCKLRLGDWEQAWNDYESRRQYLPGSLFTHFDEGAEWKGEPLNNKTIILVGEQGQGDVIQFVRLANELKSKGATVVLHCAPTLKRLLMAMTGVDQVFTVGEIIPPYDYWIPLLSAPRQLAWRLETLAWHGPYLHPANADIEQWQKRISGFAGRHIGLVWSGNDYSGEMWGQIYGRRNLAIEAFAELVAIEGLCWFSLQKGAAAKQLETFSQRQRVSDYAEEWTDFYDTAAFVANLDLVITVDTAVAHLAGALGIPVWILSRTDGCWRWFDRREDSPWYPSARVFHQGVEEPWSTVIKRVEMALRDWNSKPGA
jgi:tetratricopeptide (TPR) repeat protein